VIPEWDITGQRAQNFECSIELVLYVGRYFFRSAITAGEHYIEGSPVLLRRHRPGRTAACVAGGQN
jgi:hypothetical protein